MKFGLASPNSDYGVEPAPMACDLEERGYDSLWLGEHSNIPVSRETAPPGGGELRQGYWHIRDLFVSLAAAATVTTKLQLVTGVCLVLEHEVLDLAKSVATLDQLSGGRLKLGVGVGWNREEFENVSRVPWPKRYDAMRQTVEAMRKVWGNEGPVDYDGEWVKFAPCLSYPKTVKPSGPPILMGCQGPTGLKHVVDYADEWCPRDARFEDLEIGMRSFRAAVSAAGRDPGTIPLSMFCFSRPTAEMVERYAELGVDRMVLCAPDTPERHRSFLDRYQTLVDQFSRGG